MIEKLPEDFFNHSQPFYPYVSIQFRKRFNNEDMTKPENWKEIVLDNKNLFFDNLTLEDSGGFPKINLSLTDSTFSTLEKIIINSVVGLNLINNTYSDPAEAGLKDGENVESFLQFVVEEVGSANIRVRFGYNEERSKIKESFQDTTSIDTFKKRDGEKTIYKTPWIYLKILNVKFGLTDYGLTANIEAFSTTDNYLDKAKLWKRNSQLVGEPSNVITQLGAYLARNIVGQEKIRFDILEAPEYIPGDRTKELEPIGYIRIQLGGNPIIRQTVNEAGQTELSEIKTFKSLRQILNDICSSVLPRYYKTEEELFEDDVIRNNLEEFQENIFRVARYTFYHEYEESTKTHVIKFKYQDPFKEKENQRVVRNYLWRNYSRSIVKAININSAYEHANYFSSFKQRKSKLNDV